MRAILLINLFLMSSSVYSATWKKVTVTTPAIATGTAGTALTSAQCPSGYIFVPALSPLTVSDFCVAKFEMKNDGFGTPASVRTGTPWALITRDAARSKCQALGGNYDLISNDQWQTIARNIAGVAVNWSSGVVGTGQINGGHSDNAPANSLAPGADDTTTACSGTGQTCSSTVWDVQRRIHTLSNTNVIWDFAGNVAEWVTLDVTAAYGGLTAASMLIAGDVSQSRFGPVSNCDNPSAPPYCGMGAAIINGNGGVAVRGGAFSVTGYYTGVFAANLSPGPTFAQNDVGFRCVFTH